MRRLFAYKRTLLALFAVVVVALGGSGFWYVHAKTGVAAAVAAQYKTPEEAASVYVRFDMEAYDSILTNYWQKVKESDLAQLYQLSVEKASGQSTVTLLSQDRAGVAKMLATVFATATSTEVARQLAANTLTVVLYNLAPQGRDQLLSQVQETALRQEVSNVNPGKDLYGDLGVAKGADTQTVNTAYQEKKAELTASSSPAAKAELAQVAYAHDVLTNTADKNRYDTSQVEPTVFSRVIGHTLYLYLSQMAPATVQEFAEAVDAASTTPGLSSMVIDLRGNIGGALAFGQYFLGIFQGQNQYAFDLFHQGDYQVQRTMVPKFDELNRYEEIAVLSDNMTQSTAEVTTAAFKRFHLGHVVGGTTRGWGSVENTYALTTVIDPNTSYSMLLVNSLTLRDDNVPIEGKGVDPDVNIADKNWKSELSKYFTSSSLISAIESTVTSPPKK